MNQNNTFPFSPFLKSYTMKNKSKNAYENYLNELYADCYAWNDVLDNFSHYKNGKITKNALLNAYHNHTLGTLQRKYDSIAFNVGYSDYSR